VRTFSEISIEEGVVHMLSLKKKCLTTTIAMSLFSAGGLATLAMAQSSQTAPNEQSQQGANVSDAELLAFAQASAAVEQVKAKYQNRAQNVESEAQMQELQQKANQEMVSAVEDADLNVEQYNAMVGLVQSSPETQQRLMKLVGKN